MVSIKYFITSRKVICRGCGKMILKHNPKPILPLSKKRKYMFIDAKLMKMLVKAAKQWV